MTMTEPLRRNSFRLFPKFFRLLQKVRYLLIDLLSIFSYILQEKFIVDTVMVKNINFTKRIYLMIKW
mgnify:CR=1 FL=1